MDILQLYSGQNISSGDYIYRIERPAEGLSALEGVTVINLDLLDSSNKSLLIDVPLLILHHLTDPDLLPVVAERRKLSFPTIYELADNFRFSQEHRPEARRTGPPEYHVVMEELIRRCDAVQTTNTALQSRYSNLNRNFFIFPNLIDKVRSRTSDWYDSTKITVGWGGSVRHFTDIEHYAGAITDWILKHPEVRFAIMATGKIQRLFNKLPPDQLMLRNPGSLEEYLSFLDELDIGIAPLLPTEFNACRSDVKYLEYASREVVPLCSRFGPYLDIGADGENILLFGDVSELVYHLETLRTNPDHRKKIARQARQWVEKNRLSHKRHWEFRAEIYRKLIRGFSRGNKSVFENHPHDIKSDVGKLLIQGIDASLPEDSISILKKAVDLYPDNYQVHYFYGWALFKVGEYRGAMQALKYALTIRPDSIRSAQLLTRILLISGDFDSALRIAEEALRFEPNLPTLLTLKAIVLQLKNHHEEALRILEACIDQAPTFVEAELAYARSAIALGLISKAEQSAERLRQLIPDSPEVPAMFALISLALGNFNEAKRYSTEALKLDPQHQRSRKLLETLK